MTGVNRFKGILNIEQMMADNLVDDERPKVLQQQTHLTKPVGCTEKTGQKILERLDDIERHLSLLMISGVKLDGRLLDIRNENETTARAMMAEFDRKIGRR